MQVRNIYERYFVCHSFCRRYGKTLEHLIFYKQQHKQEGIRTDGDCCFNHIIGLPQKDGHDKPLYDYERLIFDFLGTSKDNNNKHREGSTS